MTYTNVFGGNTIYPSDVSYLSLSLSADNPLEWPLESSGTEDPAARIIDVTPTASGFSVIMPDATQTGAGQTILFNNLSGSFSFFVKDFLGNTLATVGFGEQWQLYLAATTTAAGTWRVFRFGASTATVQPSALAGFGLTVTNATLSQSLPVTTFSTSGLTLAVSNRAGAFVWNGAGAGTLNLPTAVSVGNNYFVLVRNAGGGSLTIDPAGTETINAASTLVLRPGDSATVITDGAQWYTVGFGQDAVFAFDYTSISVTGGDYTLAGSELNRISYRFVGTLTNDVYIIVPATVQQYWITNATTGSFNFYVKIAGGTPTQVVQGAKGIYYCDGANIILASDPTTLTTPIAVSQGGTGATTASSARFNLGITLFADPIVTATTGASVRSTIGAAAAGANSDITSLTALTSVGIGTATPATLLQVSGSATTAAVRVANTGAGASTFDGSGAGLDLIAGNMNTTTKYAPAIKFGSTDADFTTTVPKYGAAITAEAAMDYSGDTSGGMALTFWTAPTTPGTGSGLVARMQITAAGTLSVLGTSSALVSGSGGLGYGTGSGGAVTQTVSRTTGVTLNKTNGSITLVSAAGTTAWQSFTVTNSLVAVSDVVRVCQRSGTDLYQIHVTAVAAGSFRVTFATTGGTTTETPVFSFAVLKAVTA
jgi:hypothetical protein